jgi:hypothetical protein
MHREKPVTDDGEEYLAAVQSLRTPHRLPDVKAARFTAWCGDGGIGIDTTQIYTMIRPAQLKQAVSFYEEPARRMLMNQTQPENRFQDIGEIMSEEHSHVPQTWSQNF